MGGFGAWTPPIELETHPKSPKFGRPRTRLAFHPKLELIRGRLESRRVRRTCTRARRGSELKRMRRPGVPVACATRLRVLTRSSMTGCVHRLSLTGHAPCCFTSCARIFFGVVLPRQTDSIAYTACCTFSKPCSSIKKRYATRSSRVGPLISSRIDSTVPS